MKSMKLNKTIRKDICDSVMDQWEKSNPEPDITKAHNAFGDWLYKRHFGKFMDAFAKVPNEFLRTTKQVAFMHEGSTRQVHMSEERPFNWGQYQTRTLEIFDKAPKQLQKMLDVEDAHGEWTQQRKELERETKLVLDSVNTTNQLIEAWPAVEPFFPAYIANPDKGIRLPAIQTSRLTERLGLVTKNSSS